MDGLPEERQQSWPLVRRLQEEPRPIPASPLGQRVALLGSSPGQGRKQVTRQGKEQRPALCVGFCTPQLFPWPGQVQSLLYPGPPPTYCTQPAAGQGQHCLDGSDQHCCCRGCHSLSSPCCVPGPVPTMLREHLARLTPRRILSLMGKRA